MLGDRDGSTCSAEVTHFVFEHLRGLGYDVKINDPFKGVELVRAYYRIPCAAVRKRLFDLTKAVAGMPATAQSEDDGDDLL